MRLAGGGKMAARIRNKLKRGPKSVSENMAVEPKGLQPTSIRSSFLCTGNDGVKKKEKPRINLENRNKSCF